MIVVLLTVVTGGDVEVETFTVTVLSIVVAGMVKSGIESVVINVTVEVGVESDEVGGKGGGQLRGGGDGQRETALAHLLLPSPLSVHNSYNQKRQNVESPHFENEGPTQLKKLGLGEARPYIL